MTHWGEASAVEDTDHGIPNEADQTAAHLHRIQSTVQRGFLGGLRGLGADHLTFLSHLDTMVAKVVICLLFTLFVHLVLVLRKSPYGA